MTVWVRRDTCAVCNQLVQWDDKRKLLSCGCGVFPASFVNLREFKPVKELLVHE